MGKEQAAGYVTGQMHKFQHAYLYEALGTKPVTGGIPHSPAPTTVAMDGKHEVKQGTAPYPWASSAEKADRLERVKSDFRRALGSD